MLTFSNDQINNLVKQKRESVVQAISDRMADEFDVKAADRPALLEVIRPIANTAWGWGIESGNLVRLHVYLSKMLGIDYYTVMPALGQVLQDTQLSDDSKLTYLSNWLDAFKARTDAKN